MTKKPHSFLHPLRKRVQTLVSSESITQSEFAKESDINYLVDKHIKAGIPFPTHSIDDYRDVSSLGDFQQAQDAVVRARESWMDLDAKIRRHFGDKVENFLSALEDPNRQDELIRLKVFNKPVDEPNGSSRAQQGPGVVDPGSSPKGSKKGGGSTAGGGTEGSAQ